MRTTGAPAPTSARLRPLLREAARRAVAFGRPVLVSSTIALDAPPEPRLLPGNDAFLWQQPDREFALWGAGAVLELPSTGPGRFDDLRTAVEDLMRDAVTDVEPGLAIAPPLFVSGFAFDPEARDAADWPAFPDGLVLLPRLLYGSSAGTSWLTMNALVAPDTDVDAVADSFELAASDPLSPRERVRVREAQPLEGARDDRRELLVTSPDALGSWSDSVAALTDLIAAGEAEKVVLARRVQVESAAPIDLDAVIDRLRGRYPNCTVFALRRDGACFVGATPERLVRLDGREVRADCLAGSAKRGATPEEDDALGAALLGDDKERREHAMVVRGLRESLADVCAAIDAPASPSLRRMANVQHLYTPLTATTDGDRHVLELVERLHPTPAVGGLPSRRAACLIRRFEGFDRGWYAAPIGWFDAAGSGEFAVALRSALVRESSATLYAGCGIVRGSDPKREYDESGLKLEAMLWALKD